QMLTRVGPLLLPQLDAKVSIDLLLKSLFPKSFIQKIRQPPAGIEDLQSPEHLPGDDIFTGWPDDQRAAKLSLPGWFAETAPLPVQFSEHANASCGVSGGASSTVSMGRLDCPQSRHGCL